MQTTAKIYKKKSPATGEGDGGKGVCAKIRTRYKKKNKGSVTG